MGAEVVCKTRAGFGCISISLWPPFETLAKFYSLLILWATPSAAGSRSLLIVSRVQILSIVASRSWHHWFPDLSFGLPHVFSARLRGYRALGHPKTQLPRLFSTRVRGYRGVLVPECMVTTRFYHPHARLPRALAPENAITLQF